MIDLDDATRWPPDGRASRFRLAAWHRWEQGIRCYRGGDASAPFVGDAILEAQDEALDLALYVAEAARSGALSPGEARSLGRMARDAWEILDRAANRSRGNR